MRSFLPFNGHIIGYEDLEIAILETFGKKVSIVQAEEWRNKSFQRIEVYKLEDYLEEHNAEINTWLETQYDNYHYISKCNWPGIETVMTELVNRKEIPDGQYLILVAY